MVAGIRNTEPLSALKDRFPKIHAELLSIFARLEAHYRDMCDTEFTIEQGKLWMLQTRVGKRTGRAALKMAVDMVGERAIRLTKEEAIERITGDHLDQVLHPQFSGTGYEVLTKGLGASPGAAVGRVYLTADDAQAAAERGEKVVLVRSETSPEDVHGMLAAEGILTARGGLVSHAAVVARGLGQAGRGRGRGGAGGRLVLLGGGHRGQRRATGSRSTAPPARSCWARCRWPKARPRRSSRPSWAGPTPSAPATSGSGPTPTTDRMRPRRGTTGPRASGCAGPSTCSWPRTACPSCAG